MLKKGFSACEFLPFLPLAGDVTHLDALSLLPDSVPLFCYKLHYSCTLITLESSYRWSRNLIQYIWILRIQIRRCFIFHFSLFSFLQLFLFKCDAIPQSYWYLVSEMAIPLFFKWCFLKTLPVSNLFRHVCLLPEDLSSTVSYSRSTIFHS